MKAIKVVNPKQERVFLELPGRINAGDPFYIRPLDKDVRAVFDPKKNKLLAQGTCERFLFYTSEGELFGRVAVFINPRYKQSQPTGGIGFFDCTNNQRQAHFIFDFAKNFLQERGMQAMDGPINFGERDKFWGLLTEGHQEPLYGMNYNPLYYKELFESYGFKNYFDHGKHRGNQAG